MADISAYAPSTAASVRIRKARPSDFDAIRRLHRATFAEHAAREPAFDVKTPFIEDYLTGLTRPFAWLRGVFGGQRAFVLVAEVDGTVAGHIAYTRYANRFGPYAAVVGDVSTDPALRRTGLARRLVEAMERREARDGVTGFAAGIWPENRASRQFFESLGYAPMDRTGTEGDPQTLFQKTIEFGNLPLAVMLGKSAALTLFLIAALYLLRMALFG